MQDNSIPAEWDDPERKHGFQENLDQLAFDLDDQVADTIEREDSDG